MSCQMVGQEIEFALSSVILVGPADSGCPECQADFVEIAAEPAMPAYLSARAYVGRDCSAWYSAPYHIGVIVTAEVPESDVPAD